MIRADIFEQSLLQFFGPVRALLEDPEVSDLLINGPNEIYVERRGVLHRTDARFPSHEALMAALRNAAQYVGKHIDETSPILEGRLPDGSRLEAIIPPAAPDGPCVAIRRFFKEKLTVQRLVQGGSLTTDAAQTLNALVCAKLNVIVAGGTGSGKTSMLNALSSFIPEGERVVVIEDSRELQLQRPHVVHLETRPPDVKDRGEVTIRDLFRATLRMRPDRIVIGELRGAEALDLLQAMTSGHGGCLTTLHATYPRDVLTRLETMALMGDVELPLAALRLQIASAVNVIVQVSRFSDGSRKVTHVSEVIGFDTAKGAFVLNDVFARVTAPGTDQTELVPRNLPHALPELHAKGLDVPASVYEASGAKERDG